MIPTWLLSVPSFTRVIILVACIISLSRQHEVLAQAPPGSTCSNTCACTEKYTYSHDGEEQLPTDGQPKTEEGKEFQIEETSSPSPNASTSASVAVVEQWSMTPDEILQLELGKLSHPQKRLYEFLTDGKGVGDTIDQVSLLALTNLVSGPYSLSLRFIPYPNEVGQVGYIPTIYALKLGAKTCFFETGFERSGKPGTWTEIKPPEEPRNYPYIKRAILRACIPASWMSGDIRAQVRAYFFNGDHSTAIGIMDFVVGATPFLGTADLVFNQGVLTQVFKGDLEAMSNICGSVSGDLFIAAKALKAIRGAAGVAKIVQVGAYSTGAGSVVFTGGYLWSKASDQGLQPFDYGRAALLGLQVVGLITDRDSQTILKSFVTRRYFTRKKPDVAPLTCGPRCVQANKDATPINLKVDLLPVTSAVSRCTNLACKTAPSPSVLDGLTLRNIDTLLRELPPEIVRRVEWKFIHLTAREVNGKEVPKSHLLDGWLNPGDLAGKATPFQHIENPSAYASKTPWLSFSDTRVFPNGVKRFGETTVFFRVHDFLNDLKKTPNCGNIAILTNKQLASFFRKKVEDALTGKDANKVQNFIKKLDQLKSKYPLEDTDYKALQLMLTDMGFTKTKAQKAMKIFTAYMHQGANAEILFFGSVPASYLRIIR